MTMPANPIHHVDTVDDPWDGPAEEAKLASPVTKARGDGMYAWHDASGADPDGDGYPDAKADSKFPHHQVGADGDPGAANEAGCTAGIQRLSQADIPASDDDGVKAHLQAHLDDSEKGETPEPDDMGPGMGKGGALLAPRYGHVAKAVYERPWALLPSMLTFIADLVRSRAAGVLPTEAEIGERLAAARAQNGERLGGYQVGAVAVLPMYGLISQRMSMMNEVSGGCSIDGLRNALREALNDSSVGAIVFDIDSPGGSVDGIPEFAAELRAARSGKKPIVGQVNTLCASAAYWLGCNMSELAVTPSGEVGSIGVFAAHEDDSAALEMQGVRVSLISAGPFKTEGNAYEPLTDVGRAAIQDQVDEFYGMFVADVARGRRTNGDNVATNYGQGRTLLARKALAAGMVDRIDTLEATVNRLQPRPAGSRASAAAISPKPAALSASVSRPDPGWNKRMKGRIR
jgi:signal peptide peptidase SppA